MTHHHRFAALALVATFAAAGCGRGDEPPLCGQDLCVTSSSAERVEARFDVTGAVGTARLEVTDTGIDVEIAAGDRVLLDVVAVRGPDHYEATLTLGGVSLDAARNGDAAAVAALQAFLASADGALLLTVLDRLESVLEPREKTADVGELAGILHLALDEVDAFVHGGDPTYGPPSGAHCWTCFYFDKGCFCISCTFEGS